MIFLRLFIAFFEIGLFGFGGGYTMISLIQGQVVTRFSWLTMREFTDIIAISEITPGSVEINSATYCGYSAIHNAGFGTLMSILGSVTATFALILPSLVLIILVSKIIIKYVPVSTIQNILMGIKPAIVGLLAATTLLLCTSDNFSTPEQPWQFCISIFLFIATIIGTKIKINPIRMIGYAATAGLLLLY
jgi:chromate transporter